MSKTADDSDRRDDAVGLAHLARSARREFIGHFGARPRWIVAAPGRVNLIGEHTDYNGGFVLPMAIDRHVVIAAASATSSTHALRVRSVAVAESVDIPLGPELRPGQPAWANYVRGVLAGFVGRGLRVPALDMLILSDLPLGGGLSSSAALEVATATLFETAAGTKLDPIDKARLCQQAEHEFAGVPCGLMDQLASVLGDEAGLLLIDCRSETVTLVPLRDDGVSMLIMNTNVRHALGDGEYAERRADCAEAASLLRVRTLRDATLEQVEAEQNRLGERLYRRARHVVSENGRTVLAAQALRAGDRDQVGALMYESHSSLRDDYEVSCTELDVLVNWAQSLGPAGGVYGARMTGGGFGGCTVSLVRSDRVTDVADDLARNYTAQTGRASSHFVTRPARGAHVLEGVPSD